MIAQEYAETASRATRMNFANGPELATSAGTEARRPPPSWRMNARLAIGLHAPCEVAPGRRGDRGRVSVRGCNAVRGTLAHASPQPQATGRLESRSPRSLPRERRADSRMSDS